MSGNSCLWQVRDWLRQESSNLEFLVLCKVSNRCYHVDMKLGVYKHYSDLLVLVIGVARHSETDEKLVAYIPLGVKSGSRITVRPYGMFFENVEVEGVSRPRFEYVGEDMPEDLAAEYLPLSK